VTQNPQVWIKEAEQAVAASNLELLRSIEDAVGHTRHTYEAVRKTVQAVRHARESTGRDMPPREQIERHLVMAERHIAEIRIQIEHQQQRIAHLRTNGHDTALAHRLLMLLFEVQEAHQKSRDMIAEELAAISAANSGTFQVIGASSC
jgi:hypothetical protein